MAVRTAYPGTQVAGDVLTAANFTKLPGGWIGWVEKTTAQTTITTEVDVTSLTATVTVGANRMIAISFLAAVKRSVADGITTLRIKDSASQLQAITFTPSNTALCIYTGSVLVQAPSTGSHTYKITALQESGTGSSTVGDTGVHSYILVEDLGPSS